MYAKYKLLRIFGLYLHMKRTGILTLQVKRKIHIQYAVKMGKCQLIVLVGEIGVV